MDYLSRTPSYCWYNNDKAMYADVYGALYNWYTAATGKLCSVGWHIPSVNDWTTLQLFLINNGYGYQGSGDEIAKSMAATDRWQSNDTPGSVGNDLKSNNSSGFSALPGGWRIHGGGGFSQIGVSGYWWLATESPFPPGGYNITIYYSSTDLMKFSAHAAYGLSVRCIKE